MPIEIKELYIKVTVNDPNPQAAQQAQQPGQENGGAKTDQDGMVAQCIEQVLEIINIKKER